MRAIDLNCDLGEGAGQDAALMPLVSSANIACGRHAGDAATMAATVTLALRHGVAIGAHPGFADRGHFGRRELTITPAEAAGLVRAQIRDLQGIALGAGARVGHVKLHGAFYNQVSRDRTLAEAVTGAVVAAGPGLAFYVLAGSELERVAKTRAGLRVVAEFFADRTYQADGSLTPRSRPDALIQDEQTAVDRVLRLVREGVVRATDGTDLVLSAGTVCLHGDGSGAVAFARRLRAELSHAGVRIQAPAP